MIGLIFIGVFVGASLTVAFVLSARDYFSVKVDKALVDNIEELETEIDSTQSPSRPPHQHCAMPTDSYAWK